MALAEGTGSNAPRKRKKRRAQPSVGFPSQAAAEAVAQPRPPQATRADCSGWGGGEARAAYKARTLRIGEKEQQLPKARSRITQNVIEKPADALSRALERTPARNVPGLKYATSSMRAAKAAGREAGQEALRQGAALEQHLRALKARPLSRRAGVEEAHFWWAQLPAEQRNVEGFRLVRAQQEQELGALTTGRTLEQLNEREAALKKALDSSETPFEILPELEDVRLLKADLPQRVEDLGASLARLDKLIAKPPKLNERKLEALRALSEDRKATLVEAGVLDASLRKRVPQPSLGWPGRRQCCTLDDDRHRVRNHAASSLSDDPSNARGAHPDTSRRKRQ